MSAAAAVYTDDVFRWQVRHEHGKPKLRPRKGMSRLSLSSCPRLPLSIINVFQMLPNDERKCPFN